MKCRCPRTSRTSCTTRSGTKTSVPNTWQVSGWGEETNGPEGHRHPGGDGRARFLVNDMTSSALDRNTIAELILGPSPLIESYISLEDQLQPNGFDLTLREVNRLTSPGSMGSGPDQRELSSTERLEFGPDGWLQLSTGPYVVTFNEIVNIPLDLMTLASTRSSLLRSAVSIHTGVGDAGYRGRFQALLVVHNAQGYALQRDARLLQLVFFHLTQPVSQGYQGRFHGENL